MTLRVVLAEDNALLRDGIVLVLADNNIEVTGAVDNVGDLLAAIIKHQPALAIVDVRMPPTHTDEGVRAAIDIRANHPDTAVLVFSQWVETKYARTLLGDNRGSVGYLLKDSIVATEDFIDAVHRVATGGTALDPEVVRQLLACPRTDEGLTRLTTREREILERLAQGRSNQAIANELFLAIRSVEKVVASIFTKLDLTPAASDHRRVLAVLRYLDTGA